jgi:hypothetical protein
MERKGIFFRAAAQTEEIARKGKMDIDCAGLCGSHHFEAARRGAHAVRALACPQVISNGTTQMHNVHLN